MFAGYSAAVIWETSQISTVREEIAISAPAIGLLAFSGRSREASNKYQARQLNSNSKSKRHCIGISKDTNSRSVYSLSH